MVGPRFDEVPCDAIDDACPVWDTPILLIDDVIEWELPPALDEYVPTGVEGALVCEANKELDGVICVVIVVEVNCWELDIVVCCVLVFRETLGDDVDSDICEMNGELVDDSLLGNVELLAW